MLGNVCSWLIFLVLVLYRGRIGGENPIHHHYFIIHTKFLHMQWRKAKRNQIFAFCSILCWQHLLFYRRKKDNEYGVSRGVDFQGLFLQSILKDRLIFLWSWNENKTAEDLEVLNMIGYSEWRWMNTTFGCTSKIEIESKQIASCYFVWWHSMPSILRSC